MEASAILKLLCKGGDEEKALCGPYEGANYLESQELTAKLHFKAKLNPLSLREWNQNYVVLPWFKTLMVNEEMSIKNMAAPIKGFSRWELLKWLRESGAKGIEAPILPSVPMELPLDASGLSVRDEIGIVWARRQERQVGPSRWVQDIAARYPIVNGWGATLLLSYKLPLQGYLTTKGKHHVLSLNIGTTMALESPVANYRICIILPEDAR